MPGADLLSRYFEAFEGTRWTPSLDDIANLRHHGEPYPGAAKEAPPARRPAPGSGEPIRRKDPAAEPAPSNPGSRHHSS